MGNRIGFVGIVLEEMRQSAQVNQIISSYGDMVTGRIGVPNHARGIAVIGLLVEECSRIFIEQEDAFLNGTFNSPLIKNIEPQASNAYNICSNIALDKIYKAKEVLDIELAGYHIFSRLIDSLTDAIITPSHAYSRLLLQRIPEQYDIKAESTYGKVQCVLDYISGMTDVYALDLYRKITGMSLPDV